MTPTQRAQLQSLDYQADSAGVRQFQKDYNTINRPSQPISVSGTLDARTAAALDVAAKTAPAFRLARKTINA